MPMQRQTEQIVGFVFLGLMLLFLAIAITTFEGTPTILLLVAAFVFLGVGIFFLSGAQRGAGDDGQSQQQSVVLSDGRLVTQSFGGGQRSCHACGGMLQASFAHCPHCGAAVAR